MDDLIKTITEKFGIDAAKAQGILGTIAEFVEDKLPGPVGSQVKKLLGGETPSASAETPAATKGVDMTGIEKEATNTLGKVKGMFDR